MPLIKEVIMDVWYYLFSPVQCGQCNRRLWMTNIDMHSCFVTTEANECR